MRPIGMVGAVLIALGALVLALGGVSYTKERDEVELGPLEVAAWRKGTVPPVVGAVAVVAGIALVLAGRRRT